MITAAMLMKGCWALNPIAYQDRKPHVWSEDGSCARCHYRRHPLLGANTQIEKFRASGGAHMSVITPRYWMQIAFDVSSAATCLRRSVGAVLVRNNRLLTSGFNGAPSGQTDCLEAGCDMHYDPTVEHDRCRRAKHAEENVIATAARYGINADGAEMYVTFKPCSSCLGLMINAGIKSVFYLSVPDGRAYAEVCKIHDIASAADQIDALGMFMSMPPA